ncbi:MAG: type II toxin-antitoxin system Phd/YefM family antitoxin [Terriglobales bacterium]
MRTVGAFDAKTHLAALLDAVEQGETVLISRHGKPVAQLAPVAAPDPETWRRVGEELRRLRARIKPGPPSIREMIESGRRY